MTPDKQVVARERYLWAISYYDGVWTGFATPHKDAAEAKLRQWMAETAPPGYYILEKLVSSQPNEGLAAELEKQLQDFDHSQPNRRDRSLAELGVWLTNRGSKLLAALRANHAAQGSGE